MIHIKRIDEMVNESTVLDRLIKSKLDNNSKLKNNLELYELGSERPYPDELYDDCGEGYDPILDVAYCKEAVFNLEEWDDIENYDDNSKSLMNLYSTSYKIVVNAEGWINDDDLYNRNDIEQFRLFFDEKCDYLKFVKDFNRIKSPLTRDYVYSAFMDFVSDTFLTEEINEDNGYEAVIY